MYALLNNISDSNFKYLMSKIVVSGIFFSVCTLFTSSTLVKICVNWCMVHVLENNYFSV